MSGPSPVELAAPLVHRLRALAAEADRPITVGVDGRSGSGKSTLVATVADALRADGTTVTVVEGDDFYLGGSAPTWDARSAAEKADTVIDWRAQRPVLEALRAGEAASYCPFDWESDDWDADERPIGEPILLDPAEVVLLDGAYSGRPELADLLDLRVLLEVPTAIRRAQLLDREGEAYRAEWEGRWSAAEDRYFGVVAPADGFDLVLGWSAPTVTAIHLAPATRLPVKAVEHAAVEAGKGIVGDRYHGTKHRHVTVQSAADLAEAAAELGHAIEPGSTRRNITISHGAIPTRPGERMRIGDVELEVVRIAAPCKLLDDGISPGARHALRRRAGTVLRALTSGEIALGDEVDLAPS
ncbi:MAG: MOSC domain-containing protein [Acidimicrobiales bacterium]|nr:MOSC domain-containing protein [Acidimicrobiales bacterium]